MKHNEAQVILGWVSSPQDFQGREREREPAWRREQRSHLSRCSRITFSIQFFFCGKLYFVFNTYHKTLHMSFCTLNLIFFILNKHSQYLKCKSFYWHVVMMTFFGHSGHISNRYSVNFYDQPTIGNLEPNQQWMIFSGLGSSFPEEIIGGWNRLIVVMYAGCLNKDSVIF